VAAVARCEPFRPLSKTAPGLFAGDYRRTVSLRCLPPTKFVRNQRSVYPAGAGKAVILRSMPANSRRVRWLSASSNQ
jgi:hypothetical protein